MAKHSVSIGKRFLREVKSQYESWIDAFVREALQNCVDAPGVKNVTFTITSDGAKTAVDFANDGKPMDEATITGKLLTLGESGKEHEGTVGGFGRAKELLYFCHDSYQVVSGRHVVRGEGCEYDLSDREAGPLNGTHSQVVIDGDYSEEFCDAVRKCVGYSQFSGTVTLNGEVLDSRTEKGRKREWEGDDSWAKVYTSNQHEHLMLVRVGGVFMFSKRIDYKGCVVVELVTSQETLTSNRDGLKYAYRCVVDSFVQNLAVNRRAAFKPKAPKYRRYVGRRLEAHFADKVLSVKLEPRAQVEQLPLAWLPPLAESLSDAEDRALAAAVRSGESKVTFGGGGGGRPVGPETVRAALEVGVSALSNPVACPDRASLAYGGNVAVNHDFVLRNELCDRMTVPCFCDPASEKFSSGSKWLIGVWAKVLVELHALFEKRGAFSVGFVFDEDVDGEPCQALYERKHDIGDIYYIAPCRLERGPNGRIDNAPRLVTRWSRSDKWEILAVAAHEFVHGEGYGYHDEKYAARLTEVLGTVLKNKDRFAHCFKA